MHVSAARSTPSLRSTEPQPAAGLGLLCRGVLIIARPVETRLLLRMKFVTATLRWQRALLALTAAGSALVFWRGTLDVFNTTKATWIALGVVAVAVVGAVRVARTRVLLLPERRVWASVAALAAALVVATLVSDTPWLSVVGRAGRHTGLVMYGAYLAVFLAAVRVHREAPPVALIAATIVAAVPVTAYGALQAAGLEPLDWQLVEGGPPVFATFGNANFLSGWLGIVAPLALLGALLRRWPGWARIASGALAVAVLGVAVASASLQGVGAGLAGVALVGAVWLFTDERARPRRWAVVGGVGALAAVAVGALVAGVGPLGEVRQAALRSLETRLGKWETAVLMARDRPLLGFGLDDYGDWFHFYRPQALATQTGIDRTTDTPHMVPLDMLTSGGVVLFAAYVALVALTAMALGRGLRHAHGVERLLLAGLGGGWVAYQLQSLVSIDVPPLAVQHYALAGAIVALGWPPTWREVRLPGAPAPVTRGGGKKRKARPQLVPVRAPAAAGIGVVALGAAAALVVPWWADAVASRAQGAGAAGDVASAQQELERAERLGFWEPKYPVTRGEFATEHDEPEEALEAFEEALARQPRGLSHAINVARQAAALEQHDRAQSAFTRALRIDPKTPEVLAEVGEYHVQHGSAERAVQLLSRAVAERDDRAEWWLQLAEAHEANGDEAAAAEAHDRAVELDPESEQAARP